MSRKMSESATEARLSDARPSPADLVLFLPYACVQLQAPFSVAVVKLLQDDYVSKSEEKSKKSARGKSTTSHHDHASHMRDSQEKDEDSLTAQDELYMDPNEVVVFAVHDLGGRLVELRLSRTHAVPRLLLKIIALCMPYQTCLSRITMRWVPINGETIYEITKILPQSHVTEVLLENTPVPQRNYYTLFEFANLKRVTISGCALTDDDCVSIATRLVHPLPASKSLHLLSLSFNRISNVGAAALGEALRSNRTLQYLNLTGNRINDIGAINILQSLMEFELTYEELLTKRARMMEYMRAKQEVYERLVKELIASAKEKFQDDGSRSVRRKTTGRPKKTSAMSLALGPGQPSTMDAIEMKANTMAGEIVGLLSDPFSVDDTETKNKQVVIEGNTMPASCTEYSLIEECLEQATSARTARAPRRLERGKSKHK